MLTRTKHLVEARVALAKAETELEHLRSTAQQARDAAETARDTSAKLQWELSLTKERAAELEDKLDEAIGSRQELEVKSAVLAERIDLMVNHGVGFPTATSTSPRPATEDAEDIEFMHAAGLLGREEVEKALEAAGLQNTEIELDFQPSDYPRLGGRA